MINRATPMITIGDGDHYVKIGNVYLATKEVPKKRQQKRLKRKFGVTIVTKDDLKSASQKVYEDAILERWKKENNKGVM